jgi:ATP-dependent DNA ligase
MREYVNSEEYITARRINKHLKVCPPNIRQQIVELILADIEAEDTSHMKFTPAEDYDGLRTQASAMANLINIQGRLMRSYKKDAYPEATKIIEALQNQIDSEREVNHMLTQEVQQLESELQLLRFNSGKI